MTTQTPEEAAPSPAVMAAARDFVDDMRRTPGIDSITLSTSGPGMEPKSVTIDTRQTPDHQQSFDAVAVPLADLAERVARLHVNIREHADEMKGDRKELRELKTTLKNRLAESGYVGEQQLEIPGFRGFDAFMFSVETKENPIMVESGDTKESTVLKLGSKRIKGWRR